MSEVHAAWSEISQRDAVIATRVFTGAWPTTSEETVIRADSERSKTRISKYEIRLRAYEIYWARIASCNFQRQLSQGSGVVSSASAGSYRPACGPVALEQADSANSGGQPDQCKNRCGHRDHDQKRQQRYGEGGKSKAHAERIKDFDSEAMMRPAPLVASTFASDEVLLTMASSDESVIDARRAVLWALFKPGAFSEIYRLAVQRAF
jgi:hypothetical protein